MSFFINPRRIISKRKLISKIKLNLKRIFISPLLWLGFVNHEYYYVHGSSTNNKVFLGKNVSTLNALFNVASGNIRVGDETIFGHNVSIITGYHKFYNGKLISLEKSMSKESEVPDNGNDINIGKGCFLGSNCIILRNVKIGDNSIVAAGAVVTKSFPENSIIAGVPAKIIGSSLSLN